MTPLSPTSHEAHALGLAYGLQGQSLITAQRIFRSRYPAAPPQRLADVQEGYDNGCVYAQEIA